MESQYRLRETADRLEISAMSRAIDLGRAQDCRMIRYAIALAAGAIPSKIGECQADMQSASASNEIPHIPRVCLRGDA
jgi:hypothetical protein